MPKTGVFSTYLHFEFDQAQKFRNYYFGLDTQLHIDLNVSLSIMVKQ